MVYVCPLCRGCGRVHEQETTAPDEITYVPVDPTPEQAMRLIEASGVLDFWDDPAEDVYGALGISLERLESSTHVNPLK